MVSTSYLPHFFYIIYFLIFVNNNIGDNMKNSSIWNNLKEYKLNNSSIKNTDILIVGGGITGITLGYLIKDLNKDVTIVDKANIGRGVTSLSSAKISYIQKDIYQKLNKKYGLESSKLYLKSQKESIDIIKNIISKNNIECDLEKIKSYLFASTNNGVKKLDNEMKMLEKLGIKCTKSNFPIEFPCVKSFFVQDTYVFHPIKYIYGVLDIIKNKINIMEKTIVLEIQKKDDEYLVFTNSGLIKAKTVVITCHYPFFIKPGFVIFKNHIEREYVNSSKIDKHYNFAAINIESSVKSIRFYKDNILYVSNNHRLNNKIDYDKNYEKSIRDFKKYFKVEPEYTWSNQDLFTTDSLPLIGCLDNNLYISTGYNGWGITNGIIGAKVISDMINGVDNIYEKLFNPKRFNLSMALNSFVDGLFYAKSYVESLIYNSDLTYVKKIDGIKYNVYKDSNGIEHFVQRKCPHMKCNVVFNSNDLTWDCPCHGSRFDIDGNVVLGPTKYDIKRK